jgi:hypothetical protein
MKIHITINKTDLKKKEYNKADHLNKCIKKDQLNYLSKLINCSFTVYDQACFNY